MSITAVSLCKQYAHTPVLHEVSFACQQGEIVGLLGPNGAGKTTTMRILSGYLPPTSGHASIAGYDTLRHAFHARANLGYLPETVPLYPEMSVLSYLNFMGRLRQLPHLKARVQTVLKQVDLLGRADSLIGSLSKGLRQRVGLAQALLHEPPVLILDEPTIGLDPRQISEVRDLLKNLRSQHTILLSTHILTEVEQICDRALILIGGRLRADLPLQQTLRGKQSQRLLVQCVQLPPEAVKLLEAGLAGVVTAVSLHRPTQTLELTLAPAYQDDKDGEGGNTAVVQFILQQGWGIRQLQPSANSLETIFLQQLRSAELDHA